MTMRESMDQERAEAIATLDKANSALSRIFNVEEGECVDCGRTFKECESDKADCGQMNE